MSTTRILRNVAVLVSLASVASASAAESESFSTQENWSIPAASLSPGSYAIRVLDRTADRAIVSIESPTGTVQATFIAVPNPAIALPARPGPVQWSTAEGHFLRGWLFPGESAVMEFAYPKAAALSIARQVQARVLAVDPDSEGMKAPPNALASNADMKIISLWLLSAKPVGPDPEKADIKAERYRPASDTSPFKHVTAVAQARLPKTASHLPLLAVLGAFLLALAASLHLARKFHNQPK